MAMAHLSQAEDRTRRTLNTIMRVLDLTDDEVGARLGLSRQLIQHRRSGRTRLRTQDIIDLAEVLDVPRSVLESDPVTAVSWLAVNRSEQVMQSSGCVTADEDVIDLTDDCVTSMSNVSTPFAAA